MGVHNNYSYRMRIDWQQELEGYRLIEIRDALRGLPFTNSTFKHRFISEQFDGAHKRLTQRILDGLIASGLVVPAEEDGEFQLTDTGISLRAAHATKRFKRDRADRAIVKLLQAARDINADPLFLHSVSAVVVYGSYITDAPDLGDIDIAVELKCRWTPGSRLGGKKTQRELMAEKFEKKYPPPASFYDKGWWRFWPEEYTRRLLRTDPAMKIIELQELELIGCPYRRIYPDIAEVPAKPDWSFNRQQVVLKTAASPQIIA